MMQAMGYQAGGVLGKAGLEENSDARTEPIMLQIKEDRGGIGLDTEKKRKIREEFEGEMKRQKVEEGDFRDRVRSEREVRRMEAQILGAQKVAERLVADDATAEVEENGEMRAGPDVSVTVTVTPLKRINVLWRGLVRHRQEMERERRVRYDLLQSLSRLPTYEDPDEDRDLIQALGKDERKGVLEEELEEEDPELDEFNALEPAERLSRLVGYLREEHHYCFWCKYQYPDESMDGCPGVTEEDHD